MMMGCKRNFSGVFLASVSWDFVTDEKESRLLWIFEEDSGFFGYLRELLGCLEEK